MKNISINLSEKQIKKIYNSLYEYQKTLSSLGAEKKEINDIMEHIKLTYLATNI